MDHGLEKLNDAVYRARKSDGRGRGPEIVFIHGLQVQKTKNAFSETWLSEDGRDLWPKSWLAESFPTAAIYLVRYDSSTWKDEKSGRLDMFATAENLLQNLLLARIGQSPRNPVILIGKDVGGLVLKEICLRASSGASTSDMKHSTAHEMRSFLKQVKCVFYFSTPHGGLHLWDPGYQAELMKTLRVHDAVAARSNDEFRKLRMQYEWRAYGLGASLPGGHGQVEVKEGSARQDLDDFCMIDANTTNLCRMKDRTSTSFVFLEKFIRETVSGFKNPDRVKLPFRADPHYVPLKQTVHGIRRRLEHADIQVAVLCGDAGTGKSSLVKYLAVQYELEEETGSKSTFWDGIFYFECGRGTDAVTVLRTMLRELRVNELTISNMYYDEAGMCFLLRNRLQNLNALIIFDDVCGDHRETFIERVVVPEAKEVKYLLTSQQKDVWRGYDICHIGDIDLSIAREIIAQHAGLQAGIAKDDEVIVDQIILDTEFHPLALATVASSVQVDREVDSRGVVRRAEWEHLRQNLLSYLADDDPGARPIAFHKLYPRSVYAAMMNAVDLLYSNKRNSEEHLQLELMCIMALFESPLPTSVVHMFTLCTKPALSIQMYRLFKKLKGRQLLQDTLVKTVVLSKHGNFIGDAIGRVTLSCIKMHSLRQRFILSCADAEIPGPDSVGFIKGTVASLSEGHSESLLLGTAFLALYGVETVKEAARRRLCNQLQILVPQNVSYEYPSPGPKERLEVVELLTWKIDEYSASKSILSALQKVVRKYIFELQIDDDNVSSLISGGYECALHFLANFVGKGQSVSCIKDSGCEMTSSAPRFVFEAINLLRTETPSKLAILSALDVVRDVVFVAACSVFRGSCPSSIIDVFDLEVLVNLLDRVHNFALCYPWLLIANLHKLSRIDRFKFQWTSLLRTRPSLPKIVMSFITKVVVYLRRNSMKWTFAAELSSELRLGVYVLSRVYAAHVVFEAMDLLCGHQTFGEEQVREIVQWISGPLQDIVRSFERTKELVTMGGFMIFSQTCLNRKLQGAISVFRSTPGLIEGIVSLACRPPTESRSRPGSTVQALSILGDWIRSDDDVRSRLSKHEGFLQVLGEVIGDYQYRDSADADGMLAHTAVRIIETFVTKDETRASVFASLPQWQHLVRDFIWRHPVDPTRTLMSSSSAMTVLFYLGYNVVNCMLGYWGYMGRPNPSQVLTPEHSERAVNVQNAFEILMDVIHKGDKIERIAALSMLGYLLEEHSSARARILAMPTAASQLAALLLEMVVGSPTLESVNDIYPNHRALKAILILCTCGGSESDLAIGSIRQIVRIPGVVERILDLIKISRDDGVLIHGMEFVCRYIEVEPENSSHISAVRDLIRDMLVSVKNKRHDMPTLLCLQRFIQESKNLSFFLSIEGSVEAVFELLSHQLVELQLVAIEKERTELLNFTETCFSFLHELATTSELAMSRIMATGTERVLHLMLDLLDKKQRQTVQVRTLEFLCYLARRSTTYDAVFQMMEWHHFIDKFSMLLHSSDPGDLEKGRWFVMKFPFVVASLGANAVPRKIVESVSGALQVSVDLLTIIHREKVSGALESLLSLLDLLTNINGVQVPGVLQSLFTLVKKSKMLRASILSPSGAMESLISFSINHPQGKERASALDILRVSCADVEFTPCLAKVLVDALPGILCQLDFKGRDSAAVHVSVARLLESLSWIGRYRVGTTACFRTEFKSLILYSPQVLKNLTGLLLRDELDCIHNCVMVVLLNPTALGTAKGPSLIVQIPGTLERIAELARRGSYPACLLLLNITGEAGPYALQYLSKCLALMISSNTGKNSKIVSEALKLLERCALQNNKALRYLIDLLHETVRYKLRTAAMSYLVSYASDSPEPPRRSTFVSLQSLVDGLDREIVSPQSLVDGPDKEIPSLVDGLDRLLFHLHRLVDRLDRELVSPQSLVDRPDREFTGETERVRNDVLPDGNRDDYSESAYDLQIEVLCILDSLVKSSLNNQLRMAKCMTGIYAHDMQRYMHVRALDAPNLKREGSMDAASTEDLAWLDSDPDAEEILSALHSLV